MYAFTELHNDYPAVVNLSEHPDGTLKLAVRTRGNGGKDYASINLTDMQAEELAEAIFKHVYAADATTPIQVEAQQEGDAMDAARWADIGKEIERAVKELPNGAKLNIELEHDAGTVKLYLPPQGDDGTGEVQGEWSGYMFSGQISRAIDAAIASVKEKT